MIHDPRRKLPQDIAGARSAARCAFGDGALREDRRAPARRPPAGAGLSFVAATDNRVVGTLRLWHVCAGPARPALLLGPLAVDDA